jgi:selenocysteine-specific elongation factor
LQSYKTPVETAHPGNRVAVNLAGVDKQLISRGHALTYPGSWESTSLVDVHYRHLADANLLMKHNAEVQVFAGTAEVNARVRLLSHEALLPGEEGWLQLQLTAPLLLAQGDRFIVRIPSPGQTIGGGVVVDPHPTRKWKRGQERVLRQLATRLNGTPEEVLEQAAALEPIKRTTLQTRVGLDSQEFDRVLAHALQRGLLIDLGNNHLLSANTARQMLQKMEQELRSFHESYPLRAGMLREELRSRVGIKITTINALLDLQNQIVITESQVRLANHQIQFSDSQERRIAALMDAMNASPYSPPSFAEAVQIVVDEDLLYALIELGNLVQIHPDVIFTRTAYEELVSTVSQIIDENGSITAGALRDHFGTSRKYAISLLEYLDSKGITRRNGDVRVHGARAKPKAAH